MTVSTGQFTTEHIAVGGTQLYVLKGGAGPPCVVLHGVEGHEGWRPFHAALASSATVYAPSHPGYGHTDCPTWITSIQHQAVFYNWFFDAAGLRDVDLVGIGIGGWIAAHMAVMCAGALRKLLLVDAAGVRPAHGEIFDIFVAPWPQVIERSFYDAHTAAEYRSIYSDAPIAEFGGIREAGRIMSMKMCYRPHMYDPALPGMLGKIRTPTLVVWGKEDHIVPIECAYQYQRAIPGAQVQVIDDCGHFAHLDRPEQLATLIREFLA